MKGNIAEQGGLDPYQAPENENPERPSHIRLVKEGSEDERALKRQQMRIREAANAAKSGIKYPEKPIAVGITPEETATLAREVEIDAAMAQARSQPHVSDGDIAAAYLEKLEQEGVLENGSLKRNPETKNAWKRLKKLFGGE